MFKPECNCNCSTGIHEALDADGTPEHLWGLTFGSGYLDEWGYWEKSCAPCARYNEQRDGIPVGSYWPFN